MKWLLILLWIIYFIVIDLYGEYVISRPVPAVIQLIATVVVIISTAGMLKYTVSTLVKYLKKKKEND